MRVRCADRIGTRRVHTRMNRERSSVDRMTALNHFAVMIAADQVGDGDLAEVNAEAVHPEGVRELRIARGDVPGDALTESEFREQTKRGSEPLLAMKPLFLDGRKRRRLRQGSS